ncbi:MAG: hypothetical protein ACI9C4_001723 [Paraglaciecola sp.]|jgi:hypothetical protein
MLEGRITQEYRAGVPVIEKGGMPESGFFCLLFLAVEEK